MRKNVLFAALVVSSSILSAACSSTGNVAGAASGAAGGGGDAAGGDGAGGSNGDGSSGGGAGDGSSGGDGSGGDGAPAVQLIGRFDTGDAAGPRTAWPGSRIVARFDGTQASAKLTQTDGFSGGPTYFNVVVDGQQTKAISVEGSQTVALADGLAAGSHTIELEKRTESPFGTIRFDGFTFTGGRGLLAPPPRLPHKMEFLGDSTIDGYGVDGDRNTTCANGTAPPQFNDVRKSVAWKTADAVKAELYLTAYSGKGIARNEDGGTADVFPTIYDRTLPDVAGPWKFASFVPDVVVVSLGGADYDGVSMGAAGFPATFTSAYASLVADIRARYGASTYVLLTVWSQHKEYNGVRSAISSAIDAVIAGRPAGERTSKFMFPESTDPDANETGCQSHANAAHHAAMAALLAAEIQQKTGWR